MMPAEDPPSLRSSAATDTENLLEMRDTSEEAILANLRDRFLQNQIYTRLGNVFIAINPNERLPIYDSAAIEEFRTEATTHAHIFAVADHAYLGIREGNKHENILFCGESGSGKSFNAQQTLRYLVSVAPSKRARVTLEKVDAISTILTSFGSARTAKNCSSTRLGYCIEMLYQSSSLEGLSIRATLPLESSRLLRRRAGDGCFRVFYDLVHGSSSETHASLGFSPNHAFFYLSGGDATKTPATDASRDAAALSALTAALEVVGFTDDQRSFIFSTLAAVLHIGNIYFTTRKNASTNADHVAVSNESALKWTALLLGLDYKQWQALFVEKRVKTDDGYTTHGYSMERALDARDSIAQTIYEELINWIMARISFFLKFQDHTGSIALFDYTGFEKYNKNALQQLTTNSANEFIENFVLTEIFEKEPDLYAKENIKCDLQDIEKTNNGRTVELLMKRPYGILPLLDDESTFPKASDESYLERCNLNHFENNLFGKEKEEFSVHHFGGTVWYTVDRFISMNRRVVSRRMIDLLCESSNVAVASMFRAMFVQRSKEEQVRLATQQLAKAATALAERLRCGNCQFVRCIRANRERVPGKWDGAVIARQARAYALIGTIRLRRAGFLVKLPFADFVSRYRCLLPCVITSCQKQSEILADILDGQGTKYHGDFQIGTSHVFLRERLARRLLEQRQSLEQRAALVIQRTVRGAITRRRFLRKRAAAIRLQAAYRMWIARKRLAAERQRAVQSLKQETQSTGALATYHKVAEDDAARPDDETITSILGTVKYLDVDEEAERALAEADQGTLVVKKICYYHNIPAEMLRPDIEPITIEKFAERNFKSHVLGVRREPIQSPFLPKEDDAAFDGAVELFRLVLRFTNDFSLKDAPLQRLGAVIVQQVIDKPSLRDELLMQLCNQCYRNRQRASAHRASTLLLSAVYAFPPSLLMLPMLLHFFAAQPRPLSEFLLESLLRRLRTPDAQAVRHFAPNRLEHAAFAALAAPVVSVGVPGDADSSILIEAHPWCTAEELAQRVLRQRGIGEPEGWTIAVETAADVFCPTGSHFIHDVLAAIDGARKKDEEEARPFFHFPNQRTLPSTKKAATSAAATTEAKPESPSPKASRRSACTSPVAEFRTQSRVPSRTESAAHDVPTLIASPVERAKVELRLIDENRRTKEANAETSIHFTPVKLGSKETSMNAPIEDDRQRHAEFSRREVVVSPDTPESDYCYTLPTKSLGARRFMAADPVRYPSPTYESRYYRPPSSLPPQFAAGQTPSAMAAVYQTAPMNGQQTMAPGCMPMQYIQYVPMMVSQPIYTQHSMQPMQQHQHQHQQSAPFYLPEGAYMANGREVPHQQPPDERLIRRAVERSAPSGIETPTVLSVASRIRRMPLPPDNADVGRFLDEVFDQVLPPEEAHNLMDTHRLAASIKGGGRRQQEGPAYYSSPPPQPPLEGMYHSLDQPAAHEPMPGQHVFYQSYPAQYASSEWMGTPTRNESGFPGLITRSHYSDGALVSPRSIYADSLEPSVPSSPYMFGENVVGRYGLTPTPASIRSQDLPTSRRNTGPTPSYISEMPSEPLMSPPAFNVKGLPRIAREAYTEPVVHGDTMNSEHPIPRKLFNPGRQYAKEQIEKEREALEKIKQRQKHLPPPVEEAIVRRPKPPQPPPQPVIPTIVHIPEEPEYPVTLAPQPTAPAPQARPVTPPARVIQPPAPAPQTPQQPQLIYSQPQALPPHRPAQENEWIYESHVDRPREAQNLVIERPQQNGVSAAAPAAIPLTPLPAQAPHRAAQQEAYSAMPLPLAARQQTTQPARQRPGVHAPNQPWKLTIRKEMFLPGEQLEDVQLIDMVFAQIIDDCRRAIAYRIRASERDTVTAILKTHRIHPDLLNKQHEISTEIKMEIIEAARKWPLYFSQIYEVIEERATENVFVLLAIGETGLRLLIHNPENQQNPLTVQDHFEFSDIKEVSLEERHVLTIRTRANMLVHLRTEQAHQIRYAIERFLYGAAKARRYVLATANYVTSESEHLSFTRNERIELIDKAGTPEGWLHGRVGTRYGIFPAEHVQPEHLDERGNHPDVPALPYSEERDENVYSGGYDYAEDDSGREKYSMMEFALLYFRQPRGGDRKDWTWKEVATKLKWTEKPMQNSLLRFENQETNKMACDSFICIMKFMCDEPLKRGETFTDVVYKLMLSLRKCEPLRDEVYCQLIRQNTANWAENPESAARGWRLFSIITAFFDCSKTLRPYLMKHLTEMANDDRRTFHATAEQCLSNLNKTFRYGGRKFLLSGVEIEELTKGKRLKRQLYVVPGGHRRVINTTSVTVVEEVVRDLCGQLNIRSVVEQQEFCLCAIIDGDKEKETIVASNDEYIQDICTELEHRGVAFSFELRRFVWLQPLRLDSAFYIDAMFFQILPDYLKGLLITPQSNGQLSSSTLDDIARLGAYIYLSSEEDRSQPLTTQSVTRVLPLTAVRSRLISTDKWMERIERKLRTLDLEDISPSHARAAFLELVEKWPSFGAAFFFVLSAGEEDREVGEVLLSINRVGLRIMSPDNYRLLAEYSLSSIGSMKRYERAPGQYLDVNVRGGNRDLKLTFHSDKVREIARLLGHYTFVYNSRKRGALNKSDMARG